MAHWWETTPWRMVQTNLPEPDMADIDAAAFAKSLKDFGAMLLFKKNEKSFQKE